MPDTLEILTREQVMEFLPAALKRACSDYHAFMDTLPDTNEAKLFTDKQNAGKAAIAHIQLLTKLAQWAGIDKKTNKNEGFDEIFELARKEAESFEIPPQDLA